MSIVKNLDKKISSLLLRPKEEITFWNRLPLRYLKRSKYFTNYKNSCGFNPITGKGHSYSWYELTKVIKGKLVLNNYKYSQQTALHINKMKQLFKLLKVKYITIEAPQGLQDLVAAKHHIARLYGKAIVRRKYARKPHNYGVKYVLEQIKNARAIGITFPAKLLKQAIVAAEMDRIKLNVRLKEKRAKRVTKTHLVPMTNVVPLFQNEVA